MTDGLVCGLWFLVVVYHRKIRPTQLWVELSWVVAIKGICQNHENKIYPDTFVAVLYM